MTKISDRLKIIIEKEGITPSKFSKKLGYDRSQTVHDILNAKSNPSYDFFYKFIKSEYSEFYNLNWLITGEGEMFKQKVQDKLILSPLQDSQPIDMQRKYNENNPVLAETSENIKSLIEILNRTLIEKDKQIESLLSIIKRNGKL